MTILKKIREIIIQFKELGIISSANGIVNAIGALFWLLLASLIGSEDYGRISYYLAIAIIASRVSLIGSANTIMVYSSKGENIQLPIYFITLISSFITALVLFFVFLYDVSISLYVIGFVVFTLVTSELLAKKRFGNFAKVIISQKILLIILALGLNYVYGINGVILGIAISFLPYSIIIFREFSKGEINFALIKKHWKFIINSYMLDLATTFNGSLDKIIILPILGFTLLGNYHLGMQFFSILTIIPVMFFQYLLPRDARAESNKKFIKILVIFSLVLAILGAIISPNIIPILHPEFNEAIEVIQIVSFAIIPFTVVTVLMSKFLGNEKSVFVLIGSIIFLGIQIPLIIYLGGILGLTGVGIAVLTAYSSQALFLGIMTRKD